MDDLGGESACSANEFEHPPSEPDDRQLAQVLRDTGDAVVIVDRDGTIVFWNSAATALFGWTALEAAGRGLELIVPDRLWSRHDRGFTRVMETGRTEYGDRLLQVPAKHRDGHAISIAFTVTLLHHAGQRSPSGIAAIIRDDTERWDAVRALRAVSATPAPAAGPGPDAAP
jgi:PAS domain S-box-containing protein